MKINNIRIQNFRGLTDLHLDFDNHVNVIIGNNGFGKSTILDVLAIMLSRLFGRIKSKSGTGRFFDIADIKYGSLETNNEISVRIGEEDISWRVTKSKSRKNSQRITNQDALRDCASQIHEQFLDDDMMNLPLAIYYSVNRAVLDVPLRISKRHDFDQLSAYDQALTGARNDFRLFFEWFRNQEDFENEMRLNPDNDNSYLDPQLNAVRCAIKSLTGFSKIRVARRPLKMEAKKGNTFFDIKQLSDGEKCLIALAGDLARRLSIANPSLDNPLEGESIVLIDEIDLHLHPKWQRMVIPSLTKTFPKCQFIVSTHSPQVLSEVKPEKIIILKEDGTFDKPEDSYGWNSDCILEDAMGTPARPEFSNIDLNRLFDLIKDENIENAKLMSAKIESKYGRFPELSRATVLIRHLEMKLK